MAWTVGAGYAYVMRAWRLSLGGDGAGWSTVQLIACTWMRHMMTALLCHAGCLVLIMT